MFSIAWQYLTGSFRAADFTDQAVPEWPPHPDRVFQALVASWAARGCIEREREALLWLERLDPPTLSVPDPPRVSRVPATYVPPNDIQAPEASWKKGVYVDSYVGILPEKRKRKLRHHGATWVGDAVCAFTWRGVTEDDLSRHEPALQELCKGVTRIGRSGSFVLCRVNREEYPPRYIPASDSPDVVKRIWIRIPRPGRLEELEEAYEAGLRPPPTVDTPYRVLTRQNGRPRHTTDTDRVFSGDLLVFRIASERTFTLNDTLLLTSSMRRELIKAATAGDPDLLPLVSGHETSGAPLGEPHLAYIPLPFVGSTYGNGNVLGLAIVRPESMNAKTIDQLYRLLGSLVDDAGDWEISVLRTETVRLASEIGSTPPNTLREESWTRSCTRWASVTPVVMDRMQNRSRSAPDRWASGEVAKMLTRSGFPEPATVRVMPVSRHRGAPAVFDTPPIVRKDGRVRRMVHVEIRFREPVSGPILIGSGRYRGYGLCKPWYTGRNDADRR